MTLAPGENNFLLAANSPAVDVVAEAAQGDGTNVDQRGKQRPQGPKFDMGAFERKGQLGNSPDDSLPVLYISSSTAFFLLKRQLG